MSDLTSTAATLTDIYLHRVRYKDNRTLRANEEGLHSQFLLSARLFDDHSVGVEFGVTCRSADGDLVVQVVYRMEFNRGPSMAADFPDEQFAREVASRIGPIVAFPFIRETIASLTSKSGDPVVMAVVNVGSMFNPDDIKIATDVDSVEEPPSKPPKALPAKSAKRNRKET